MLEIYNFAMKFQKSKHRQIFPKKLGRNRWMSVKRYKDSINSKPGLEMFGECKASRHYS